MNTALKPSIFAFCTMLLFFHAAFVPLPASGQTCPSDKQVLEGRPEGFIVFTGGLVPCGRKCDDPGSTNNETHSCTLCHLILLFFNIYNLLLALLIIVALLFLTIGGVVYIVSSGNSSMKSMAKNLVTKTLTGFALFLLSWLIVYTILIFISANTSMLGRGAWYEFTCEAVSEF